MRLPRLQFSLQTLLIATLVLGVLAGLAIKIIMHERPATRMQRVRSQVEKIVQAQVSKMSTAPENKNLAFTGYSGSGGPDYFDLEYRCNDDTRALTVFHLIVRGDVPDTGRVSLSLEYDGASRSGKYLDAIIINLTAAEIPFTLKRKDVEASGKSK